MQSLLSIVYPPQCIGCGSLVAELAGLCPTCWRDAPFIRGATCIKCGAPLPGDAPGDETAQCDDCMVTPRPWATGTAVMTYSGLARLVMALKHGDRQGLVAPLTAWMQSSLRFNLKPTDIILPVPIHWRRLIRRRFNQSALLAQALARSTGATYVPDALIRLRHTAPQEGMTAVQRFALQAGTIIAHDRRGSALINRRVLIIDDVMTSGATLAATAAAILDTGAAQVHTVTLTRVVKEG